MSELHALHFYENNRKKCNIHARGEVIKHIFGVANRGKPNEQPRLCDATDEFIAHFIAVEKGIAFRESKTG